MTNEEAGDHMFAVNGLTAEQMRLHADIEAAGGPEVFIAALRELLVEVDGDDARNGITDGLIESRAVRSARALLAKLPK